MTDQPCLNILFAGTPEFAAVHLQALINSPHTVVGAYTQPDRPSGRGKKLKPSPVKQLASSAGIPVYQPASLKEEQNQQTLAALNADVLVVVAYGLLLPQPVLDAPKYGCINVHGSILPRWRGAAPIQRCIEAGDTETGITIMQMDIGLDTGDMLDKVYCDILPTDTASTLHDKLASIGPTILLKTLSDIANNALKPEPQNNNQATYAAKLLKDEATINWEQDASEIQRRIRAFNPFPVCSSTLHYGIDTPLSAKVKIYSAQLVDHSGTQPAGSIVRFSKKELVIACGSQALAIQRLQLPGKKPVDIDAFMNGFAHLLSLESHFV